MRELTKDWLRRQRSESNKMPRNKVDCSITKNKGRLLVNPMIRAGVYLMSRMLEQTCNKTCTLFFHKHI